MIYSEQDKIDYLISLLASYVQDGDIASTGVASLLPMLAVLLAQQTHAPGCDYVNCIGAVNPAFGHAGYSSEDPAALANCVSFVQLADLFDLGVRGRIDVMFFSGAQIDQSGNINLAVIGDYTKPKVKLPGPAGSSIMLKKVQRPVLLSLKHDKRTLVSRVDFASSHALDTRTGIDLVTGLCCFRLEKSGVTLRQVHPWSSREQVEQMTGFEFGVDLDKNTAVEVRHDQLEQLDPAQARYAAELS